ncbi:MAG: transglutaminase family protein, partial [Mesorhizobium sp.]|nr:transglutaminase family protein [Mesorhizobium sp.]
PYYKPATAFPAAFAAKLDKIAAKHPQPEDRMIQAMHLVQDEIRYVSLSMGSGSYIPRDPATVIQSGFGDCKDKALLLASALQRLGVPAQVALADLDKGRALDQRLPAIRAFDHAIVKAAIGAKIYWLDATNYLQGGNASNFWQPDYGFALPLFGSGQLEKMPSPELTSPSIKVAEDFSFPDRPDGHLTLAVLSTYAGADADDMRSRLASRSLSDLSDSYLKYYSKRYPGIESVAKLEVFDNRDGNIINVRESYQLPAQALAANDLAKNFPLTAADLGTDLPTPTMVDRVGPVSLGAPVYRSHAITVSNLKARFSGEDMKNVVTPYLSLRSSWSNTPTTFDVKWDFRTLATQVPAKAIGGYLKSVKDLGDNTDWSFNFAYQDAPEDPAPAAEPDKAVRLTTILLVLSFFVGGPLLMVYRRSKS